MRISDWSSDVCSSDLEISDRVVDALAGKDVGAGSLRSLRLQILHDGKPDRTHRGAFLTVDQPKATSFEVNLAPFEIDDFSAPTARHRNQRSEEHTSELQSLMRISYAVFCLKKKKTHKTQTTLETKT